MSERIRVVVAHRDVETIVRGREIPCAAVASPHATHAAILGRLLEAGLDIYTEKPLALDRCEAERIVKLVASIRRPPTSWSACPRGRRP